MNIYAGGPHRVPSDSPSGEMAYQGYYLSERDLIRARGRVLSEYIALLDEGNADEEGFIEDLERCRRSWRRSHVDVGGGVALQGLQGDRSSPLQSQAFREPLGTSMNLMPNQDGSS
jgi:hypothetical protein